MRIVTGGLACLVACLVAVPAAASPRVQPAVGGRERADIVTLVGMTGALDVGLKLGTAMSNQMIASIKQVNPRVSDTALHDVQQAVVAIATSPSVKQQLIDAVVGIYAKHFTDNEIRQLIRFYGTPLGQKIIRTMPAIARESMAAGEAVMMPLRGELIDKIRENFARDHIDPRTLQPKASTAPAPAS